MQPGKDTRKRNMIPGTRSEMSRPRSDVYEAQENQWATLRQDVEIHQQRHPATPDNWDQRNTDGSSVSSPDAYDIAAEDLESNHVNIVVAGVGGGGMNAINRMISERVRGVRFVAMNTDAQVLALSQASTRICLGQLHTRGLGAGGNAAVGMRSATESAAEIRAALGDADLVFIAAGMGGGTGTGAAPIVASIARKMGALTVGIVTLPFTFEGSRRRKIAEQGLAELSSEIDALITVPNDRLLHSLAKERNLTDAFKVADDVLRQGVQGIAEVINVPGMVNVDFADVRSILREAGTALMSIGEGIGNNRAQLAAEQAIAGGFLNVTIRGAKRVLFNISGGEDMTLFEINEVAERIGSAIDDAAEIIFGAVIDPGLTDTLRVTLIAAGMEELHGSPMGRTGPLQQPARYTPIRHSGNLERRDLPIQRTPTVLPPVRPAQKNPLTPPPTQMPPPLRPDEQSSKLQQRSLNDLRGSRSTARRQEIASKDGSIEPPPFLRRNE